MITKDDLSSISTKQYVLLLQQAQQVSTEIDLDGEYKDNLRTLELIRTLVSCASLFSLHMDIETISEIHETIPEVIGKGKFKVRV